MPMTLFQTVAKRNEVNSFALEWASSSANLSVLCNGKHLPLG